MKRQTYTVTLQIPLTDLERSLSDIDPLRLRLLDAILEWALDNPDLLQGSPYTLVEEDDETGEVNTEDGIIS